MVKGVAPWARSSGAERLSQSCSATAGDLLPEKVHSRGGVLVRSQLALGIEPKLYLSWSIEPWYWRNGFTLMVFHSMSGFCPESSPDDLTRHGQLIIETTQDACREEHPEEGTHYYTFLLYKSHLGLFKSEELVRFSETVPSMKVALGRIKNKLELEEMRRRHELSEIEHDARLNEAEIRRIQSREKLTLAQQPKKGLSTAADGIIAEELAEIDATVETLLAKRAKIQDLKRDSRFKKLSPEEQKAVLERIEERLDAGEVSMRREMREH